MKTSTLVMSLAVSVAGVVALGGLVRAKGPKPPPVEGAGNNLSFPLILSDAVAPQDFANTYPNMDFAPIMSTDECTTGVPDGTSVPQDILCYFYNNKIWWLQEREENQWQAFNINAVLVADGGSLVDVSAVDVGDLRQLRS